LWLMLLFETNSERLFVTFLVVVVVVVFCRKKIVYASRASFADPFLLERDMSRRSRSSSRSSRSSPQRDELEWLLLYLTEVRERARAHTELK
jgi:hypothetical protein